MYVPSLLGFLPIQITTAHESQFPVLYSRFSLVVYFIHTNSISSVYVSIPISRFLPPPLPLWNPYICSLGLCFYFCFASKIIYTIFFRFHIYALIHVCFFLTSSFYMAVSNTIHIFANGTILSLLMADQFISVAQLCLTLRPRGLQHTRLSCLLPTPGACSNSC